MTASATEKADHSQPDQKCKNLLREKRVDMEDQVGPESYVSYDSDQGGEGAPEVEEVYKPAHISTFGSAM
jgi:hypothetical protein